MGASLKLISNGISSEYRDMIPQKLTLKNFLSYRDASLDFSGLHTACICGPNGAGKSSLLEAIAWSIWGHSRAGTEDDLIQIGETQMRVDFIFISHGNLYRVIRTRRRGQSGTLDFQIAPLEPDKKAEQIKFTALSQGGVRSTQQKILEHLRLDYDTFINSAYLRQGKADEFMLKRPSDRKEVLGSLLKLDEYDTLVEKAKDISKEYKFKIEQLEQTLTIGELETQKLPEIVAQMTQLEATLGKLQKQQESEQKQLQAYREQQQYRQTCEQLLEGQRQQYHGIKQECDRLQQEIIVTQTQLQQLDCIRQQQEEINAGIVEFQTLQATEETMSLQFQTHQKIQQQLRELQQQQQDKIHQLQRDKDTIETRLESLHKQEQEYQKVLVEQPEVEAGMAQLSQARLRLNELDKLQIEVTPILQEHQRIQGEIDRAQARLSARLDELYTSMHKMQNRLENNRPELEQELQNLHKIIGEIENKRTYQNRVTAKGQSRHNYLEKLAHQQHEYEAKLAELDKKMEMLGRSFSEENRGDSAPVCPLCDRPLDEHHWNLVMGKHQNQQQEIRDRLWIIREDLARSEQEIAALRVEYTTLQRQISNYEELREQRGQLQARLEGFGSDELQLQQWGDEASQIERSLSDGSHSATLYQQLQQLDLQLQELDYNEQSHALARNEEKRWRWAEMKQIQIRDSQQKLGQLQADKPPMVAQLQSALDQIIYLQTASELQQRIIQLKKQLNESGYNLEDHNQVRVRLREAQQWVRKAEQLKVAESQYPQIQQRLTELRQLNQVRSQDLSGVKSQILLLTKQLEDTPNPRLYISNLEGKIKQQRQQLDQYLSQLGKLQQQRIHLENLSQQQSQQKQELSEYRHQALIYKELAQAFGKNGIQALMIENVLPQLEAETNQILARLSANQLHVQFVTQRSGRSGSAKRKKAKLIDTLDILIADARGTRPYETYSGGEAFRINFAIRLALAKLLAQRAGCALQMLIIDEGFGTQDAEGCDRLIAAINAIAPDFSCILAVTHIPHLKEAFQAKIEVTKTATGSQLHLSV